MYKIGDYLVYKKDVCLVKDIKNDHYILTPVLDSSLTINIPANNDLGFIRDIISPAQAELLIKSIPDIKPIDIEDRQLENEYKRLLQSGNLEDLIKIIITTYERNEKRINNNKKIGEKDNNYFKLAEKCLYNELSLSLNKTFDETKEYVINSLK